MKHITQDEYKWKEKQNIFILTLMMMFILLLPHNKNDLPTANNYRKIFATPFPLPPRKVLPANQ